MANMSWCLLHQNHHLIQFLQLLYEEGVIIYYYYDTRMLRHTGDNQHQGPTSLP